MEVSALLSATRRCSLRRWPTSADSPLSRFPDTRSSRRLVSAPMPGQAPPQQLTRCGFSAAVPTGLHRLPHSCEGPGDISGLHCSLPMAPQGSYQACAVARLSTDSVQHDGQHHLWATPGKQLCITQVQVQHRALSCC